MAASYRDLVVWQRAMELAVSVYQATDRFPTSERYGLSAQLRSAGVSVPSNIAEGYGRRSPRQRYNFLEVALGSVYEVETQIELASRLCFLEAEMNEQLAAAIAQVGRGLTGLMKFVEKEARTQTKNRHQSEGSRK